MVEKNSCRKYYPSEKFTIDIINYELLVISSRISCWTMGMSKVYLSISEAAKGHSLRVTSRIPNPRFIKNVSFECVQSRQKQPTDIKYLCLTSLVLYPGVRTTTRFFDLQYC